MSGDLVDADNSTNKSQNQELADSPELELSELELLDFHRKLRPGQLLRQLLRGSEACCKNPSSETWPRTWSSGSSSLSRADLAEVGASGRRATLPSGTSAKIRSSPRLRDDQNTDKRVHRKFALAGG